MQRWRVLLVVAAGAVAFATACSVDGSSPPRPPEGSSVKPRKVVFPDETNTGVKDSARMRLYDGPCTIATAGSVLRDVRVQCERLVIAAPDVKISNAELPPVDVDGADRSVTIEDSTIDAGDYVGPAVGYGNLTIRRSEVRGGQHSILCGSNCLVEGSWLHSQSLPSDEGRHNNAFLSNGGAGVVLRGNTFECSPQNNAAEGGCSADISLYGDFAPIEDVTIESNLLKSTPGGFCLRLGADPRKVYGAKTANVSVKANTFEAGGTGKCGAFGAMTSVPDTVTWSDNVWSNGTSLELPE